MYNFITLLKIRRFDHLDLISDTSCAKGDGVYCSNSANDNLYNILKTFEDCSQFHFVDLGCGKGGALFITAAFFNFNKITGVEREIDFISSCKKNLQNYREVEIICEDVINFSISSTMNLFYMYNPFGSKTIDKVVENILLSYRENKRDIYILYKNAVEHKLLLSKGFKVIETFLLKKLKGKRHWNYESMPNSEVKLYKLSKEHIFYQS